MEPSEEPNPAVSPAPMAAPDLFDFPRPTKKRNYIRRGDKSELEAANPIIAPAATQATKVTESTVVDLQNMIITSTTRKTTSDEDDEIGVPGGLAQILRRGKKQGRAKKGLDIAEVVPKVSRDIEDTTLQPEEGDSKGATEQELAAVVNRFTHQTGQVLNVDKHM